MGNEKLYGDIYFPDQANKTSLATDANGKLIAGSGGMVYPRSGIAKSTGAAWDTSISGTSSQFVKGDGSLDSSTYVPTSATKHLIMFGDLRGAYKTSADWQLMSSYANPGITITRIYVDCSVASPTTQLSGKIKYCDALAGGAFPGANPTDIATITTTAGNFDSGVISSAVPSGKIVYLEMTASPTDFNTTWNIDIQYNTT